MELTSALFLLYCVAVVPVGSSSNEAADLTSLKADEGDDAQWLLAAVVSLSSCSLAAIQAGIKQQQ